MLVPAISQKKELEELFSKEIYKEDFFYYAGWAYCHELPDIKPNNNVFQWAILDGERVIGYLAYDVEPAVDCVNSFGLYSFDRGNPIIGKDLFKTLKHLVERFHRIEWRVVDGNPVMRHYDWFCKKHNGNKVTLHDCCKDLNGHYRDCHIYEIIRNNHGEYIKGEVK